MNAFIIIYLPAFILAYLLISFVVPSIRVYRQTGINPVTFGKSDNAHDYIGGVMKLITGILVLTVFFHSLFLWFLFFFDFSESVFSSPYP